MKAPVKVTVLYSLLPSNPLWNDILVSRINREMGVLDSTSSVFVLISYDNDFVSSYQHLKGGGETVGLMFGISCRHF